MSSKKKTKPVLPPGPVMVDVARHDADQGREAPPAQPPWWRVILFARNFTDRRQLCALTRAIHRRRARAAADRGGPRRRPRAALSRRWLYRVAAHEELGKLWDRDPLAAMRLATEAGYVLAAELQRLRRRSQLHAGIGPRLRREQGDRQSRLPTMTRAWSPCCRALAQGLALAGMAACGKHFPGHGFVGADSHHEIPVDPRPLARILKDDAAPYAWLGDLVMPAVMPAHVIYPKVDAQPAGFSRRWVSEILRERLGYDGVVFSDDLTMEGASGGGRHPGLRRGGPGRRLRHGAGMQPPGPGRRAAGPPAGPASGRPVERIRRMMPRFAAPDWDTLQNDSRYQHARRLQSQIVSG